MFLYIVKPGDTLPKIAENSGTDVSMLAHMNNINPPYAIHPGQPLLLPLKDFYYTVEMGDSLWSISRLFGKDMDEIAKLNELTPPYLINLGQRLKIPAPISYHIVKPGDTLWKISRQHLVDLNRLIKANNSRPPYILLPQQYVVLPGYMPKLNGEIAFYGHISDTQPDKLQIINLRSMKIRDIVGVGLTQFLSLSKDGSKIGFINSAMNEEPVNLVCVYDTIADNLKKFKIDSYMTVYWMDWSYDNSKIVYVGDNICILDADTGRELNRFSGRFLISPNWFINNRDIIYLESEQNTDTINIVIRNTQTSQTSVFKRGVTSISGTDFIKLSYDNKKLALVYYDPNKNYEGYTTVYDMSSGSELISNMHGRFQSWSRDSRKFILREDIIEFHYMKVYVVENIGGAIVQRLAAITPNFQTGVNLDAWFDSLNAVMVIGGDLYVSNVANDLLVRLTMGYYVYEEDAVPLLV